MKRRMMDMASRVVLFGLLWLTLAGWRWETPVIGGIAILAGVATSLWLWPAGGPHLRWSRIPALAGYFLVHSARGGIDVARRVFSPAMPIRPELIRYETSLRSEAGRVLFTWMIGMMPGTASVHLEQGHVLTVHVIDLGDYDRDGLRALEVKIAAVFDAGSG